MVRLLPEDRQHFAVLGFVLVCRCRILVAVGGAAGDVSELRIAAAECRAGMS